ncbi:phage major capsid protein [Geminicoccus harenae]|uniref:phage major capsid protein n=1 Tax=Geminicoccus harenae TaxID=2498453 RepID=UPI00168BAEAF|nr:phage major capsid protein [Geminicoccus harenae]
MPSPNLSEIITTTLEHRSRKLADQISKNNALLFRLKKRGTMKPVGGGRNIVQELEYAENGTYKRYSGYEILNISPQDVFTAAEFEWKQAAISVSISGLEQMQNRGEEQMIDLLEARIANAERSFENNLAADCYSDGTADGGKQIGGLQLLVADDPTTGTMGGINRANWPFWRNQVFDANSDGTGAVTHQNIQGYMNRLYLKCVRQTDKPDLIIADDNYFTAYWESLQAMQRITSAELGEAGFHTLKFQGADVVYDGGQGGFCPTDHMYFLNTKYIHFRPHRDRNMVPLGGERASVNQDAIVKLMAWMGNMTISNAALQGVLKA